MLVIPTNTATAALRRIPFTLVDATDLITPRDITVTGVKAMLSIAGGTPDPSTNDIVKVDGTVGEYYIELTHSEANVAAGSYVRGWLEPSGCKLEKFTAQIGAASVVAERLSSGEIGDAVTAKLAQVSESADGTTVTIQTEAGPVTYTRTPSAITSRTRALTPE